MSYDAIRQQAQEIADSYPLTEKQREVVEDLALPDNGPLIEWARQYVRPHTKAFLDYVIREATAIGRGGRNSRECFRLFAYLSLGWAGRSDTAINIFLDRLGVPEQDARKAIEAVSKIEGLTEEQSAELCARFLRSFMADPQRRAQVFGWLGIAEARQG